MDVSPYNLHQPRGDESVVSCCASNVAAGSRSNVGLKRSASSLSFVVLGNAGKDATVSAAGDQLRYILAIDRGRLTHL
jgi:hypothetical protein